MFMLEWLRDRRDSHAGNYISYRKSERLEYGFGVWDQKGRIGLSQQGVNSEVSSSYAAEGETENHEGIKRLENFLGL
jgi:hypothetical protein